MSVIKCLLSVLISSSLAVPFGPPIKDSVALAIAAANIPKYLAPTSLNRDITQWLAIGDFFAAGISADVPNDKLEYHCSRFAKLYPNQINDIIFI